MLHQLQHKEDEYRAANPSWMDQVMIFARSGKMHGPIEVCSSRWGTSKIAFFFLDAAWLNEGRCPGGRPSVSKH